MTKTGKKSQKRRVKGLGSSPRPPLHLHQPNAAGIDVGATEIFVAVPENRDPQPVRSFSTFTSGLLEAAQWMKDCGVRSAVVESTGVYWISLYQILEAQGFQVLLVNARHVKNVPGRKSDVQDCQWLQYLHSVGLLNGSFRPPGEVVPLRSILRHRSEMVKDSSSSVLQIQKSLTQMNLQLHHVLSDITGVTGLALLDAILGGERDPLKLAELRNPSVKASTETIIKALQGDYRPEHLFTLRQSLASYRHYQRMIAECDLEIDHLLEEMARRRDPEAGSPPGSSDSSDPSNLSDPSSPQALDSSSPQALDGHKAPGSPDTPGSPGTPGAISSAEIEGVKGRRKKGARIPTGGSEASSPPKLERRACLQRILGTDLTLLDGVGLGTTLLFLAEVGPVLDRFPTSEHFCSWLGLAPHNKVSGGKILSSSTLPGSNRLGQALRLAAQSLWHNKAPMGEFFRGKLMRLGAPGAITATAHKLARVIYVLIKAGADYRQEILFPSHQDMRLVRERKVKKMAHSLGFRLVPLQPEVGVS